VINAKQLQCLTIFYPGWHLFNPLEAALKAHAIYPATAESKVNKPVEVNTKVKTYA